jgi:hypothetical protein
LVLSLDDQAIGEADQAAPLSNVIAERACAFSLVPQDERAVAH